MDKELMDMLVDENVDKTEETKEEVTEDASQTSEEASSKAEEETEESQEAGSDKEAPVEEEEVKLTKAEYQKLVSQISELSAKVKPEPKETKEETKEPEDKDIDFLGQEKLDDIFSEPSKVNALLNKIRRAAREEGITLARENILRSLPEVVRTSVSRFTALREMVSDFYVENPDLKPHKQFVGLVANEVASNNPDKINQPNGIKWIFKEAAKEARTRLKLKPASKGRPAESGKDRTLPGGSGGSSQRSGKSTPEKKGVAKEIDDMLATLQ